MEPNWGNTHAEDCPVTIERRTLWQDFTQAICKGPNSDRDYLWGAVIEYCAGGDQDVETCTCPTHHPRDDLRIRNIKNIHVQFNRLHAALWYAAQDTNDPRLKRWAEQIDAEHHEFHDELNRNTMDLG